jgi:hypothetical protein
MTALAIGLVVLGITGVLVGLLFSFIPGLPGPPFSALSPFLVLSGFLAGGFSVPTAPWIFAFLFALIGVVVTVADLLAPLAGKLLGGTSRGAVIGSYYGLSLAMLFSLQLGSVSGAASLVTMGFTLLLGGSAGVILLLLGPLVGGFVGELASAQGETAMVRPQMATMVKGALLAGIAQCAGLLLTTTTKVVYGLGSALLCTVFIAWLLAAS